MDLKLSRLLTVTPLPQLLSQQVWTATYPYQNTPQLLMLIVETKTNLFPHQAYAFQRESKL